MESEIANALDPCRRRFLSGLTASIVHMNTICVSLDPQELQGVLDELSASRASRKNAWENLQQLRRILKEVAGLDLPAPAAKNIALEGRLVRDGMRKALISRQTALNDLVKAIQQYRQSADHQAVHALNKALERAELLLPQ